MARHFGVEDTFTRTPCGVFFGEPGKTVADPYFGGDGPARTGCIRCGACMVGCRVGAKNTLVKNYLWFAEKRGARSCPSAGGRRRPARRGRRQRGLPGHDRAPRRLVRQAPQDASPRAAWSFAAGALGTNQLLASCKHGGSLPRVSDRLGELVRTNSESILAVRLPEDRKTWNDVAISCSIHVDRDTHIEFVTYGRKARLHVAALHRAGRQGQPG